MPGLPISCVARTDLASFAVIIQAFDVFIVDFRHIADDVGQRRTVRIVTTFIAFNAGTRKTVLVDGKRELLLVRLVFTGIEVKRCERARSFECNNIIIGPDQPRCAKRPAFAARYRLSPASHFYLVDSAVESQRDTVTVVDNAAAGCDRHQLNAVFIRAGLVVGKANNLQIIQVGDKHAGQQQNPQKATSARRTNSADSAV